MTVESRPRSILSPALCLLTCLASPAWVAAGAGPANTAVPALAKTYVQLRDALQQVAARSATAAGPYRLHAGPLVLADRDGDGTPDNAGLITIAPAEMDAIMNSVPGNDDAASPRYRWNTRERFGLSTQGREILAAHIGNPAGVRVLVITQQHGNEYTGTEAALQVLEDLSRSRQPGVRRLLDHLNLLVILRANPDGGEPDATRCVMATDMYDGVVRQGSPFLSAADGSRVKDCAFYRSNVDPRVDSLTQLPSGAIYGYYGHGFNLNRYHFIGFDDPLSAQYGNYIYPVEDQAMIAVAREFKPQVIWDLHDNNEQVVCDRAGFAPQSDQDLFYYSPFSPRLARADCVGKSKLINTSIYINETTGDRAKRLAASIAKTLDDTPFGSVSRFAQTAATLPPDAGLADDSYGTYVYSDGTRPFLAGTHEVAAIDELVASFQTDTAFTEPYEPGGNFLPHQAARIGLHRLGLTTLLNAVAFEREQRLPPARAWGQLPQPQLFLPAFSGQLVGAFSDPWFYIVFGELDEADLARAPYLAALTSRGIPAAYASCDILSTMGLCRSVIDSDPGNHQERTAAFQYEWRSGIPADYLHRSVQLTIDPL